MLLDERTQGACGRKTNIGGIGAAAALGVLGQAGGPQTEVPYNPQRKMAKAGGPEIWADFETAARAVEARGYEAWASVRHRRRGWWVWTSITAFQGGQLDPWAAAWVERLNNYTEISPSGTGLHVICRG